MDGFCQEIQNIAHMEFIQYWREDSDSLPKEYKEYLKHLYCAAFISGAIAAQKLVALSLDGIAEDKVEDDD